METSINVAQVHFVAGKGGVGKTLVSCALARFFSRRFNTLYVELEESETNPINAATINVIDRNLSSVKICPDQALYEYLSIKIPNKQVLSAFLKHDLIRALSSSMPGLSDLTRLGKIWFHAHKDANNPALFFDKIVVDMPSSGFVGRFLSVAGVVRDAVKIGPIAKEAQLMDAFFSEATHARLHLITLLEDLVVNETIELYAQLHKSCGVALGALFINKTLPMGLEEITLLKSGMISESPSLNKIIDLFRDRIEEQILQRDRFFQSGIMLPQIILGDYMGEERDNIIVENMVKEIAASDIFKNAPNKKSLKPS